jgi:ligand-binding sensor domain-containing protein
MSRVLVILLLTVGLCWAAEDAAAPITRSDLIPKSVYWQVLPSDVRDVKIDRDGRAWFELEGLASVDDIKRQIEASMKLPAPFVRGARVLMFDSAGRIWVCPSSTTLLAYEPKSGSWIEHDLPKPSSTGGTVVDFCGPAIEDKAGRVFIADRLGCHVFDHGAWSYQPFYELNIANNNFFGDPHLFYIPTMVADSRGRIFAWTLWGMDGGTGTLGFWVHEGSSWHQTMMDVGERAGHISAVIPVGDGKAIVCPEIGRVLVGRIDFDDTTNVSRLQDDIADLGNSDFRRRRAAERRILALGPHVLPALHRAVASADSPEQRNRLQSAISILEEPPMQPQINDFVLTNARLAGYNEHGRAVLWADTTGPDGRSGRTAAWEVTGDAKVTPAVDAISDWAPHAMLTDRHGRLFMARYQKGLGVIDNGQVTRLSDDTDIPFDEILGQDHDGRVYVRNRWHVAAINLDVADTRRALPVTVFELSASRAMACRDSSGRTIAKLSGAEHQFLSYFIDRHFKDFSLPPGSPWISDAAYLQTLKDGALVTQDQPGGDVLYFDGNSWSAYHSFRALIEKQFAAVRQKIDNRRFGVESYASLRTDSAGNIWCGQWDHVDVYDGTRWQTLAGVGDSVAMSRPILCCVPELKGGGMLISDGVATVIAKLSPTAIQTLPLKQVRIARVPAGGLGAKLDSAGRIWLPRSDDSATMIQGDVAKAVSATGQPRFEDSGGRMWLLNPLKREWIVVNAEGVSVGVSDDAISEDSSVAEESANSFWINTRGGLRHIVGDSSGRLHIEGDYYEKGMPKGPCNTMWIDSSRVLWFSGAGRLYRIELP